LREIFEARIPFNQVLGLRVASLDPQTPRLAFDMRPEMVGNFTRGMLHGGVISATLDAAGGLAATLAIFERHAGQGESVEAQLARFGRVGTIDLRVDYLRPGIGKQFETRSQVLRSGSRVAVVRSDLHNESDVLIASAVAAYTVG
jgi:uncharacterized protein (TIGR00369 family)